jgi:hypothetical protein
MTTAPATNTRRPVRTGAALLLLSLLAGMHLPAAAGEQPAWLEAPAEETFTGEEAPTPEEIGEVPLRRTGGSGETWFRKPVFEMNLRELLAFQSFYYTSGGRDPFFFSKPPEREEGDLGMGEMPVIPPPAPPPPTAQEKFDYLVKQKVRIELLLLLHDYDQAMTVSNEVRRTVEGDWGGAPTEPENNRLWRKILSYRKTARRLKQARETRQEFEAANIAIGGIRWTPTDQGALINDRIYEPGEVLEQPIGGERVQIESIEEDSVVFIFKGRRFRRWIDGAAGTAAADR